MQPLIFDTSGRILPTSPAVNLIVNSIPHIVSPASPDGLTTLLIGTAAQRQNDQRPRSIQRGTITFANDQAARLFGWPKAEFQGQRVESLVSTSR